nr:HD domain-containing protein [Rhizobium sp. ACO-34A]
MNPSTTDESKKQSELQQAIAVAKLAHEGQMDKTGRPYFTHCARIAATDNDPVFKIVAYLHDVVEKGTGWNAHRLRAEGFSIPVLSAVDALTRQANESEETYFARIMSNSLASRVKLADLRDNIMQAVRSGGNVEKYRTGIVLLQGFAGANTRPWSGDAPPQTAR